jgi:hypothetical protein
MKRRQVGKGDRGAAKGEPRRREKWTKKKKRVQGRVGEIQVACPCLDWKGFPYRKLSYRSHLVIPKIY